MFRKLSGDFLCRVMGIKIDKIRITGYHLTAQPAQFFCQIGSALDGLCFYLLHVFLIFKGSKSAGLPGDSFHTDFHYNSSGPCPAQV